MVYVWAGLAAAALLAGLFALLLYRRWASGHTRRRIVAAISVVLCLAVILASMGLAIMELARYQRSADQYRHIQQAAAGSESIPADSTGGTDSSGPPIDFDALRTINPDVAGWLVCGGTEINYPVAQGADNSRYLDTLFDGSKGKAGCLFVDFENDAGFSGQNTVVYGHNLLDGSMLSGIVRYGEQGYFDAHPTMTLHTPEGSYTVELFAGYTAPPTNHALAPDSPWALSWPDEAGFAAWLEKAQGRSNFDSGVRVSSSDRVLTLSTCADGGRNRFVLHGRLAPIG
jgi:SrtB family sortase